MRWFSADVRFGLRMLRKNPAHTAISVIALGVGLGLTIAAFSIVYGVCLRGLPFPHGDRILMLSGENPLRDLHQLETDVHDLADWRARQTVFEQLEAFEDATHTLTVKGTAERLSGTAITSGMLRLLRVEPVLGRGFQPRDEAPGAEPVVLLGTRLFKDRYDGDPAILGRQVRLDGRPATVVGVVAEDFRFPEDSELFIPHILDLGAKPRGEAARVQIVGRLRDGVSVDTAQAQMSAIAQALGSEFPRTNAGLGVVVQPFLERFIGKEFRVALFAMLGAVLAVLVIACINVASLGMARAAQRTREVAIRTALGAGRGRVVAQLLIESVLLAATGALLGVGLGWIGIHAFNAAVLDRNPPFWMKVLLDPPALWCALAATVAAGLISGLAPALHAARTDLNEVLKDEGRGSTSQRLGWFSRWVVIAEIALSCALLVGAGLMVKSVVKAQTVPLGFDAGGVLTFRVPTFPERVPLAAERAAFFTRLRDRLATIGGVQAVAATESLPTNGSDAYAKDADRPAAHNQVITPGLFAALRVHLLAGRDFERLDTASSQPVVIVNRSLARKEWPGQDPLGKRLRLAGAAEPWRTVIGVVPDLGMDGLEDRRPAGFYLPVAQSGPERMTFVLRTAGPPLALVGAARAEVTALDKDAPIYFVYTLEQAVDRNRFTANIMGSLFSIFGIAALVLAAVGIFGVISLTVERRTQEIGLRMALGADRGDVMGMLLRQGARQLAFGLALGLPAAWGLSRLLGGALFKVDPSDPTVFALVVSMLCIVALVATLLPGRRAIDVDPLVAIRSE
jgi:predicted permease